MTNHTKTIKILKAKTIKTANNIFKKKTLSRVFFIGCFFVIRFSPYIKIFLIHYNISKKSLKMRLFYFTIYFNYMNNGANTNATIVINLIKMFNEGPEVSLNGSPTVSPTTAAL